MDIGHRWLGVGHSADPDPFRSGLAAAGLALTGRRPVLLIVFASGSTDPAALLAGIDTACPDVPLIGCSSELLVTTDGAATRGVVVTALGGPGFVVRTAARSSAGGAQRTAGEAVARSGIDILAEHPGDPARTGAAGRGHRAHEVLIMLTDGWVADQEEILAGAYGAVGARIPVIGGSASPDPAGRRPYQLHGRTVLHDHVVGATITSTGPLGFGIRHGWRDVGEPMIVTRSAPGQVWTLDDRPALHAYLDRYAAPAEAYTDPAAFERFAQSRPIGIRRRHGVEVRSVSSSSSLADGILRPSGEIPEGALVWPMEGDAASATAAAADAVRDAVGALGDAPPLGLLAFDCVSRSHMLGEQGTREEVRQMRGPAADATSAVRVATERAARVLEAEVAVVLGGGAVLSSVGFIQGRVPVPDLHAVTRGARVLDVPGAGRCHTAVAPVGGHLGGHLLVARSGPDGFGVDEVSLLRGMARVLELTVATLHTVEALRQRQRLLEQLSVIQRAITRRSPLQTILDAITGGARELLGDDITALHVVDPDDPDMLLLLASTGLPKDLRRRLWRIPGARAGVVGEAVRRDELLVGVDHGIGPAAIAELGGASIQAAMAAPVHDNSTVVGSLMVASQRSGRSYAQLDREVLGVFAEHVSLAVTDAKTQEAMAQAFHDSLTGLASRPLFLDRLSHALARAAHEGTMLGVLFVDLDRFKTVNDSLGHSAGDALLVDVAERLRSCLGVSDTAARLGGDEFAVLCELSEPGRVTATAEKIIKRLQDPFTIHGHETFIDASIGVAFDTAGTQGTSDVIRDADLAMYEAKRKGKGRYELFRPQLRRTFLRSLDVEARLRQAIDRDDLVLLYQPIVSLAQVGGVVGAEALVRWRDGDRGLVSPVEFIPLAEETGLILSIDRWVLHRACRQGATWNSRPGARPVTVSVNLSARQVEHPGLPDLVSAALSRSGLDPARLVLEITESGLMHDTAATTDRLHELKALGVRVAIDDFGTGYSSLAYLRQFPVDVMKIDKSFVDGTCDPSSPAATLARAIVQLGRTLDLTTVAEGVESAAQADRLRAYGCDLAQGFHFAAPLAADEVARLTAPTDPPR